MALTVDQLIAVMVALTALLGALAGVLIAVREVLLTRTRDPSSGRRRR